MRAPPEEAALEGFVLRPAPWGSLRVPRGSHGSISSKFLSPLSVFSRWLIIWNIAFLRHTLSPNPTPKTIYSLGKYLWSDSSMLGTILDGEHTVVNKVEEKPL